MTVPQLPALSYGPGPVLRLPSAPEPFEVPSPLVGGVEASGPPPWLQDQLMARRIVLLSGTLDHDAVNRVALALMTLDANGDESVQLQIDSDDGTTSAAHALIDVVDLLGVPVYATCIGRIAGPALGVFAVCQHRTMSPHATLRLIEPPVEVHGNARQLEQLVSAHSGSWEAFCRRLSEITGQAIDRIQDDAARGRFFSAAEAIDYGLVDEVATPDARMYRLPGRPMGYRAR